MIRTTLRLVGLGLVVAGAVQLGFRLDHESTPGEGSVDVGFARAMSTHHAQAVQLAELLRDRTTDEELRILAGDIALTQQAQIGMMRGWLDGWDLLPTSTDPPMAWMHGADSDDEAAMPGLASDEEVAAVAAATGDEAERLVLRLMIRHHQGGVHMAAAAADLADEGLVRELARGMSEAQEAEITYLQELLAERGGQPLPAPRLDPAAAPADDDSTRSELQEWLERWGLVVAGGVALVLLVADVLGDPRRTQSIARTSAALATVAGVPDEYHHRPERATGDGRERLRERAELDPDLAELELEFDPGPEHDPDTEPERD